MATHLTYISRIQTIRLTVFQRGGKRNAENTAQADPKTKRKPSFQTSRHALVQTAQQWHTNAGWGCKEGRKTEKRTPPKRDRHHGKRMGSQWSRAGLWCVSFHPGPGPRAWETGTREWAWAAGGWVSGCQGGKGPVILPTRSWDGHPTLGASSSPAYICFKNSSETTTQAPR